MHAVCLATSRRTLMKIQPKLKPRIPVQAAPVARRGEGKKEKGVGLSIIGVQIGIAQYDLGVPFAADDAE
jgi:hypothetical protein